MNEVTNRVPVWERYALTVNDAVSYFGIGEKTLRRLAKEYIDDGFIIQNGAKVLFKRKKFEQFLDTISVI